MWIANYEKKRHIVASGLAKGFLLEIVFLVLRVSNLIVNPEIGTRFRDLFYYARRVFLDCEMLHSDGDQFPTGAWCGLCAWRYSLISGKLTTEPDAEHIEPRIGVDLLGVGFIFNLHFLFEFVVGIDRYIVIYKREESTQPHQKKKKNPGSKCPEL